MPDQAQLHILHEGVAQWNEWTRANAEAIQKQLWFIDLKDANLSGVDLRKANLARANLSSANFSSANLEETNLDGAYLESADLSGATLFRGSLIGAHLYKANLRGAYLRGANLSSACLQKANLTGANLPSHFASWSAFKSVELSRDGQPTTGVNVNECLDDIEKYGFHITDAHVRITETAIR